VGKQPISTGTGYVWNPTDVFNIKDVFDPTYEQPGHNAVQVEIPIGLEFTVTGLFSPEENWKHSTKMLQIKGQMLHFDFALIGIERMWTFHDYTQIDAELGYFSGTPQRRNLYGFSTAGEIFTVGVWAEYAYNDMQYSRNFTELVAGFNYTFDFETFVMAEYYKNTLGKTDPAQYTLNDWMRTFTAEQKTLSRDQIYLLAQHPLTDLLDFGMSGIMSLSDNSIALVPTFTYSFSENVDLLAYFSLNLGNEGTVYARDQGNGGLLRARIWF
jgi:hypothetical protein